MSEPGLQTEHKVDGGDLPVLSLSVDRSSITEEDDDTTTDTAENVSTVTVAITNGETFAEDQTVTLSFFGAATSFYIVSPTDADINTAGHQVVLPKETSSVAVTVTATANDTADGNQTLTVEGDLDGTVIGSEDITILDDETSPNKVATGTPAITGTAQVGSELTADISGIADEDGLPEAFTFQWLRVDTANIEMDIGEDTNTYTPMAGDVGYRIKVKVSFIDALFNPEGPLTSNATAAVTSANTGPLVLTVEAVDAEVTEGQPVRYRIRMSRRTPGAVVESEYGYEGDFVQNPYSLVVSGINSHLAYDDGLSWVVSYATVDDAVVEKPTAVSRSRSSARPRSGSPTVTISTSTPTARATRWARRRRRR